MSLLSTGPALRHEFGRQITSYGYRGSLNQFSLCYGLRAARGQMQQLAYRGGTYNSGLIGIHCQNHTRIRLKKPAN